MSRSDGKTTGSALIVGYSIQSNALDLPDGAIYEFHRRWETVLLALLCSAAERCEAVSAGRLHGELASWGQVRPLNRSQHLRLLKSLATGLALIPGQPVTLTWSPRKATVGPWGLQFRHAVRFVPTDNDSAPRASGRPETEVWPYPMLLDRSAPVTDFLRVLTSLVVADALVAEGRYREAIDYISALQPEKERMTEDGQALVAMRLSQWHRAVGEYRDARKFAERVARLAAGHLCDPAFETWAAYFVHRVAYDEAPGTNWRWLYEATQKSPNANGADFRTMPEWHNLRGLLLRRKIADLAKSRDVGDQEILMLHRLAMCHQQSAIYRVLAERQWWRVQDFVANLALYLQSIVPLRLCGVADVAACYAMNMNVAEKFDVGGHSAWAYLFLGKFWLDYEGELSEQPKHVQGIWAAIDAAHPSEEVFWLDAIERVRVCGDLRQLAIAKINRVRFARRHLPPERRAVAERSLRRTLRQYPEIEAVLRSDGYGEWLPSAHRK